jgi:hypothetical protein
MNHPIAPIWREARILYYRWARHDLRGKPGDPGVAEVIIALNDLYAQRARPRLHTRDGGHAVRDGIGLRIDPALREDKADPRPRLALWGALLIVLLWLAMRAAGIPVPLLF